jgi:hypothetical protein
MVFPQLQMSSLKEASRHGGQGPLWQMCCHNELALDESELLNTLQCMHASRT